MLSSKDIIKELGRNIAIYPFKKSIIQGASINLTASNMAWSVDTKKTIVSDDKTIITIPAHDTGLIETNEVLGVSLKIGGTYHSRVRDVSRGIGHIGTTLNPGWVGRSLIALHNGTNNPIKINVDDSIVTICFYYLNSKSTIGETNDSARKDVLQEYELCSDDCKTIYAEDYSKDFELLRIKMVEDSDYMEYKDKRTKLIKNISLYTSISIILIGLLVWLLCTNKSSKIYEIIFGIFSGVFGILGVIVGVIIGKKHI